MGYDGRVRFTSGVGIDGFHNYKTPVKYSVRVFVKYSKLRLAEQGYYRDSAIILRMLRGIGYYRRLQNANLGLL